MLLLSRLLLSPAFSQFAPNAKTSQLDSELLNIGSEDLDQLAGLASSNHVVIRGMERLAAAMAIREDALRRQWVGSLLTRERERIANVMSFLGPVCAVLEYAGHDAIVIKSLDHWPDLGSDVDLYTNAAPKAVVALMKRHFLAELAPRSWGDRLARKWNFLLPGLPEAVEIHMGRLGQTGEQRILAASVVRRAGRIELDGASYRVPHTSDRLMISALQRMYRHFYFRLCDIVDTAALVERGAIDYEDLRRSAQAAGIWEGVATYLVIVADYLNQFRGSGLHLPDSVVATARFGGEKVFYAKGFLRIPILPQSAGLYGAQLTRLLRRHQLVSSARLGLLPWLATAAVVGQKVTGSDKGVW